MDFKKINKAVIIPVVLVVVFSTMNLFSFYTSGEHVFFDLFLKLSPEVEEDESIVLLNIDDLAIARVGMFPWSRSIMADGLILMKEMGAKYAVFDIEYTEESPKELNNDFLNNEMPKALEREFSEINSHTNGLINAIISGNIPLEDAAEYASQLKDLNESAKKDLTDKINRISRDNDVYFGQAARYFGKACFTINMVMNEEQEYSEELKKWVHDNMSIEVNASQDAQLLSSVDIRPAVAPITREAFSLGFPNVTIDSDGVRRRIQLISECDGKYYPQLSFQAVYDILGRPEIDVDKNHIILKGAKFPDGRVEDVIIPLDPEGNFIINWPHKEFDESFNQFSYYYLVLHKEQERLLVENLEIMNDAGFLNYYQGNASLLDIYNYGNSLLQDMLNGGDLEQIEEYRQIREYFFSETENYLNGDAKDLMLSKIDSLIASPAVDDLKKEQYRSIRDSVENSFTETLKITNLLKETRTTLKDNLNDATCFIGWTGTATTDRGVNPFDETYDNVGTHASVANTILNDKYLDVYPQWISIIAAVLIVFLFFKIESGRSPSVGLLIGVGFLAFIFIAAYLFFRFTGIYFPIFTPVMVTFFTFIGLTVVNFLSTSKEKVFIRNAFGQYLSNEVINDLLDNPDKLSLGGEKKFLTALFTDVKGFSTISEAMDPTELVSLLNMYLTEMSDIIMDQHGTIDKFEGDAIISFFGAPADYPDHAYKACLSAIVMKRAEAIMNEKVLKEKLSPYPLLTRIGVNTGDMVVGNMGTAKKMDYTMMGNAVNLAARLEGVNKRYGTWLMISESAYDAGGNQFAVRRLDRVRVVGINTPVRLFELVEEKNRLTKEKKEVLDIFDEGLTIFEERDWVKAEKFFKQVLAVAEKDGPANYYLARCTEYQKTPPKDNWDGVYNLTEK